jgi:hypothetical protein
MTQRKPSELSFDSWIDVQIREARERGLFDELPGAGQPQTGLHDAEDPMWWAKQFLQREGVSVLPVAVEVRVRAQKLREVLASFPSERAVREAAEALNADIRRVNRTAAEGPPTSQAPLDVEQLVAQWRSARARGEAASSSAAESTALRLTSGGSAASRGDARRIRRASRSIKPGSDREP